MPGSQPYDDAMNAHNDAQKAWYQNYMSTRQRTEPPGGWESPGLAALNGFGSSIWGNTFGAIIQRGHELGDRIGTGFGAAQGFVNNVNGAFSISEQRLKSALAEAAEVRPASEAQRPVDLLVEETGQALISGVREPITEGLKVADGVLATGELAMDVYAIVEGGMAVKGLVGDETAAGVQMALASGAEGEIGQMRVLRAIQPGETISHIIDEAKAITFNTGNEVALVELASGERALVTGGPGGITWGEGEVTRIFGHTHPYGLPPTGPSDFDVQALQQLGQRSSYLLEHGQLTRFGVKSGG